MSNCPNCGRKYGKRQRCYYCQPAKQKTGKIINCLTCGKEFYAQKNELKNKRQGERRFCSSSCKSKWQLGRYPNIPVGKRVAQHTRGYWLVWVGHNHPYNHQGRLLEHRFLMEKKFGRYLDKNEIVHHINGKLDDNRLENLELMTHSAHATMHMKEHDNLHIKKGG